jgi:cytochrome c
MEMFEFNKIAGAALSALLLAFGMGTLIEVFKPHGSSKPGYTLPVSAPAAAGGAAAAVAAFDFKKIQPMLASAKADAGQAAFKKCTTCHTPDKGGKNGQGPNLWGIIGKKMGGHEGFNYSDSVKGKGGTWSFDTLAAYIYDPKGYIPGNKMAFAGIKDEAELADVLAYLRTLADSPAPLPQ